MQASHHVSGPTIAPPLREKTSCGGEQARNSWGDDPRREREEAVIKSIVPPAARAMSNSPTTVVPHAPPHSALAAGSASNCASAACSAKDLGTKSELVKCEQLLRKVATAWGEVPEARWAIGATAALLAGISSAGAGSDLGRNQGWAVEGFRTPLHRMLLGSVHTELNMRAAGA